jgi:site-specific DNA recombinase
MSTIKRAGLYIRVSHEEQAKHGYSLDAQHEDLTRYAKEHGYIIQDYYADEGISARKKPSNRKEFIRMLDDVRAKKIDIILFIKLDRWFRSVADYYKTQEILDKYGVDWATSQEQYDTTTSNGRLHLNIKLSIAQNESDQTSDRIKFVFREKVKRGEVITGAIPLGFKKENKHLVKGDLAPVIVEAFQYYLKYNTINGVVKFLKEEHGISRHRASVRSMLKNEIYTGSCHANPNFAEQIIEPNLFYAVQKVLDERNIKKQRTDRVYLFSGLLRCPACHGKLSVVASTLNNILFVYYRCPNAYNGTMCKSRLRVSEKKLEQKLLNNLEKSMQNYIASFKIKKKVTKIKKVNPASIKAKLTKLKDLYIDDLIDKEVYAQDYAKYTKELKAAILPIEKESKNINPKILELQGQNVVELYNALTRESKKLFWRQIIDHVEFEDKEPHIFFY